MTEVCVDNRNFRKKAMENGYGASVGVAPALLSSDYNGPKVVIEERSTPPRSLERAIEDGIAQKQRNGGGTFIGTSPTLLSTDYKGPHVVIEKKEGNSETT